MNSNSANVLINVKPLRARFGARRGVALLRAWRLRFARAERLRATQIEFNFRTPTQRNPSTASPRRKISRVGP